MNRYLTCLCLSLGFVSVLVGQDTKPASGAPATARRVALAPDTCPLVRPGDILTLDWNPGFSPSWPVQDMGTFGFHLRQKAYDTHGHLGQPLLLGPPRPVAAAAPGANGFFHLEMTVQGDLPPSGEYYVESMEAHPHLAADFQGSAPPMTNSPAQARLCISFQNPGRFHPALSGGN